jgi:hypothetical protein
MDLGALSLPRIKAFFKFQDNLTNAIQDDTG